MDAISLLPLFFSIGSKDWIQVLMFATEVLLSNELSLAPPQRSWVKSLALQSIKFSLFTMNFKLGILCRHHTIF